MTEYAIYRGEDLLFTGTAQECADELGVTKKYIQWLTTPSGMKRLAALKRPEKGVTAVKFKDDE
ncbi:hypothetical protein LZ578_08730 [Jeotgalibaca sp. MA1X17-3]|uniref:hypothetical protein n=1 Tax=Jeotgalibaca sp. MA1X17-3 TaxID=2908211 RepID=UPI001F458B34|nr:hypothetical protein [Jeotgalibaca sp. MA1X17-3]UJF15082.1 hypothetical protein LZ578_08730 [Jeotgalibaca sp. MA1X17-3]